MFIDIHNHLVWGVDNGIKNEVEAIASLRHAVRDQITTIIATPHYYPKQTNDIQLLEKINKLRRLANQYQITVHEGCELMLHEGFVEAIEQKQIITLAHTRYILVEFDFTRPFPSIEESVDMMHEIISRDYIPVLAHVERYFEKGIDYDYLQCWKESGCIFQLNRSSIAGIHGEQKKILALDLIRKGYAHLIATDTHSTQRRICKLSDSYQIITEEFGEKIAKVLHIENPRKILEDGTLETILPL